MWDMTELHGVSISLVECGALEGQKELITKGIDHKVNMLPQSDSLASDLYVHKFHGALLHTGLETCSFRT